MTGAIVTSLVLAVLTVVIMLVLLVPTMVWVRLRVPWAARPLEFLCLLPLTVPPLVIVVGLKNVVLWLNYLFGDTPYVLALLYVVLVLPYAYRALDAGLVVDRRDRRWPRRRGASARAGRTVVVRVIVPNLTTALLSAAFISIALVLGEFTFASLLNYDTLQVAINLQSKSERAGVDRRLAGLDPLRGPAAARPLRGQRRPPAHGRAARRHGRGDDRQPGAVGPHGLVTDRRMTPAATPSEGRP